MKKLWNWKCKRYKNAFRQKVKNLKKGTGGENLPVTQEI